MKLENIQSPNDIKHLSIKELDDLAQQIREFLIDSISKTGGHLSSNLGVVELTLALHYVFQSPQDKLIFDVGHQSYIHKLLTGRKEGFKSLRQFKGMSGFQKRSESIHDAWESGHSSTSLSAALGFAVARDLKKEKHYVIPIIGDGSMGSGMAMEALNQIGSEQRNMIIIFNDNNMSISKNVGAMDAAFTRLRTSKSYNILKEDVSDKLSKSKMGKNVLDSMRHVKNVVKENVVDTSIFGEFGIDYLGPVNGHSIKTLIKTLQIAKYHKGPIVVHVITKKGKGYAPAENDCDGSWHGVSKFDKHTGKSLTKTKIGDCSWSEIIAKTIDTFAKEDPTITVITPAMISGSKLHTLFQKYPQRCFDVGIAEEHAVTFAAAQALNGLRPFVSIYSSFMQRAFDQLHHDVARMSAPVVFGIDRAELVGEDGDTHHGVFDISMLNSLPNFILSQPKDAKEAQQLLKTAFSQSKYPFAIRYPRGNTKFENLANIEEIPIGSWSQYYIGSEDVKLVVITYGNAVNEVIALAKENNLSILVINARFFKPMDTAMLDMIALLQIPIIVYSGDIESGGLFSEISTYYHKSNQIVKLCSIAIEDTFVEHGNVTLLKQAHHIDLSTLLKIIQDIIHETR